MSFILDALKKSEAERQQQAGAEFAAVPAGTGESRSLKWLWILAGLLAVNFAVLGGLLLRPSAPPPAPAPAATPEQPPESTAVVTPSFEERVAKARERETEPEVPVPAEQPVAQPQAPAVKQTPPPASAGQSSMLPRFNELRAEGVLQLPDLHLDIHVYSDVPKERFVFINMTKLREGDRLDEGPVVKSITPDGVVLDYQGTSFLLPRE